MEKRGRQAAANGPRGPTREFDHTKGFPGEGPKAKPRTLSTVNITAASKWTEYRALQSGDSIAFILEHRLRGEPLCAWEERIRRGGFEVTSPQASLTEKWDTAGGVAIAVHDDIGIQPVIAG